MFRPSKIITDTFVRRLEIDYRKIYGDGPPGHLETISVSARMALSRLARSNALYHNLEHTMLVSLVGEDILRGKLYRDGSVPSIDWVHFMVGLFCFALGFTRNLCPGDKGHVVTIAEDGTTVTMQRGATDGSLWPYFTDRSKIFVRHYYRDHHIIDPETVVQYVEYGRFPPLPDRNHEISSYPGLLRAAQVIGAIADPDFSMKMTRLWLELRECGMHEALGYESVSDLRDTYPTFFWQMLHPLIPEGADLLTYTGSGRLWLANMHAHVLQEEHRDETVIIPDMSGCSEDAAPNAAE